MLERGSGNNEVAPEERGVDLVAICAVADVDVCDGGGVLGEMISFREEEQGGATDEGESDGAAEAGRGGGGGRRVSVVSVAGERQVGFGFVGAAEGHGTGIGTRLW